MEKQLKHLLGLLWFGLSMLPGLQAQSASSAWPEDMAYIQKQLEKTFPHFESHPQQSEVEQRFSELRERLESLSDFEVLAGIQYALNPLGDESARIPFFQTRLNTPIISLKTYLFEDGLYVCDAPKAHSEWIGKRISTINGMPVMAVKEKLAHYINADNGQYVDYAFPLYANMPALLAAAQLGTNTDSITLESSDGLSASFKAQPYETYAALERKLPNDGHFQNTSFADSPFWFAPLPDNQGLFVQLKRIQNPKDGPNFSSFIKDLKKLLNQKPNILILDLRYGGGGNGFKLKPFTDLIREQQTQDPKFQLLVLIGRGTRGTLAELASILSLNTKAIFIGESTAEGPNTVADSKYIELPQTGFVVSIPHVFWPTSWAADNRKWISPDKVIDYSFEAYQKHTDPWLDAALNYTPPKALAPVPMEIANSLVGKHQIGGRNLTVEKQGQQLLLRMNRRLKSFFEIHTELYYASEGVLATDIPQVFVHYDIENHTITQLDWKGVNIQ
ncbi:hypothetical protein [Sediminicola luteus]|nr:hypothetical protein [Sediminicola luteus]